VRREKGAGLLKTAGSFFISFLQPLGCHAACSDIPAGGVDGPPLQAKSAAASADPQNTKREYLKVHAAMLPMMAF
jgi:hypothetical protein